MEHKFNCLICGSEIIYPQTPQKAVCQYCKKEENTSVICSQGHYVCDTCHFATANEFIEKFCLHTDLTDPIQMATEIMNHPSVKMHGPEHHFLVPAVLYTATINISGKETGFEKKISQIKHRAEQVAGGFCGFHGACGAAIGTGICMSILTQTTPLSTKGWKLANYQTASALTEIAEHGGPRCCKRNTYLAILNARQMIKKEFDISLPVKENFKCSFTHKNKECLHEECPFF